MERPKTVTGDPRANHPFPSYVGRSRCEDNRRGWMKVFQETTGWSAVKAGGGFSPPVDSQARRACGREEKVRNERDGEIGGSVDGASLNTGAVGYIRRRGGGGGGGMLSFVQGISGHGETSWREEGRGLRTESFQGYVGFAGARSL